MVRHQLQGGGGSKLSGEVAAGLGELALELAESEQGGEDGPQHLGASNMGTLPCPSRLKGTKGSPSGGTLSLSAP